MWLNMGQVGQKAEEIVRKRGPMGGVMFMWLFVLECLNYGDTIF